MCKSNRVLEVNKNRFLGWPLSALWRGAFSFYAIVIIIISILSMFRICTGWFLRSKDVILSSGGLFLSDADIFSKMKPTTNQGFDYSNGRCSYIVSEIDQLVEAFIFCILHRNYIPKVCDEIHTLRWRSKNWYDNCF